MFEFTLKADEVSIECLSSITSITIRYPVFKIKKKNQDILSFLILALREKGSQEDVWRNEKKNETYSTKHERKKSVFVHVCVYCFVGQSGDRIPWPCQMKCHSEATVNKR